MANLQELEYDGERVFSDNTTFPASLIEAAGRLSAYDLKELLMYCQGTFETSHPQYVGPSREIFDLAGPELIEFLTNYQDPETGDLWMEGK